MSDRAAFLRNIAEFRFSTLPRMVYADWLDECGPDQPADAKRAELIRAASYLAEATEEHRPALHCDCDRCRLSRRIDELSDEGISNYPDPEPSHRLNFEKLAVVGGFPVAAIAIADLPITDDSVGLEVARCFAAWPLTSLLVTLSESGRGAGTPYRWIMRTYLNSDPHRDGYSVHVELVPEFFDAGIATALRAGAAEHAWIFQYQWASSEHRIAAKPGDVPDVIRRAVKKAAVDRWWRRNAEDGRTNRDRRGIGRRPLRGLLDRGD